MTWKASRKLRSLEGRTVHVALTDGSRLDGCQLVSVGRRTVGHVWLFADGADHFIPFERVLDLWEVVPQAAPAARRGL